jgi:hypothetical protein
MWVYEYFTSLIFQTRCSSGYALSIVLIYKQKYISLVISWNYFYLFWCHRMRFFWVFKYSVSCLSNVGFHYLTTATYRYPRRYSSLESIIILNRQILLIWKISSIVLEVLEVLEMSLSSFHPLLCSRKQNKG